jgi:single-stranded-DNA-specific exonuclease
VVLADWPRLARDDALAERFEHVLLIDPPPLARLAEQIDRVGAGFLHLAWGPPEVELSLRVWESQWPSRPALAALYRELRDDASEGDPVSASRLLELLRGSADRPRSPEVAARSLRVLLELGIAAWAPANGEGPVTDRALGVVSSEGTDLTRSAAFVAYRERHEEGRRYLSGRRQTE